MSRPFFAVPVADLEKADRELEWDVPLEWLERVLDKTEARPRGAGKLELILSKSGPEVVVRGRVRAPVVMPCARTLDPVDIDVDADIFLMLSPAATPAGRDSGRRQDGKRRRSRNDSETDLEEVDAASDTYEGEIVVLDDFIREFILLELPMFPLRSDLRADEKPTIEAPPGGATTANPVDPRLAPLEALARRLRSKE